MSKLPDIEFKTVVIRILRNLVRTWTSWKKDMEAIFKKSEMKSTLAEIRKKLQGINSQVDEAEN